MSDKPSIDSIFCAAIDIESPEERRALVEQACGEDADLKQQVERLLHAHYHGRSILDAPVQPVATLDEPLRETVGTVIGPYKLLDQIGEGGMGTVWMAEQKEPIQRRVAVKVIKAGMDSRQVLARFEAERQALALMDHPNIARVLDAGTTEAHRPFFVMELVKGTPITTYCDDKHLSVRERLELFGDVCRAVQHAHQKGIIHRDLKPSNILIAPFDGRPVVKVIDFGVAKATGQRLTDATLFTAFGAVIGTPEYMSPEQAETNNQDIDTRSDIYSLGVLLYELLTGSTPLTRRRVKEAALLEVLRVIREEEPPRPSTRLSSTEELPSISAQRQSEPAKLTKLVRGELDWIVMRALEKDRGRRYETANAFAMDVQRHLAGEPVLAAPASHWYRLRKFARRNKSGLVVAALVLFFLVLLGSGVGWVVRDRSAREAEAARQQGERQTKVAGQVELTFAEVDRLEKEQKWLEALEAARRAQAAAAGGETDPATAQRVRRRLMDLEFIDRLEQVRTLRQTWVKGSFDNVGADRGYARAFREYGVDIDELPVETAIDRLKARPALAVVLAAALDDWVFVRRLLSPADVGRWNRLVAVARGIDPDPLRDRVRAAWGQPVATVRDDLRRLADSIDVRVQHPATLNILARTLLRCQEQDSAIRILREAQHVHAGDFWLNLELGMMLGLQKNQEEKVRFLTAAVAIRPRLVVAHNNLGVALFEQKKLDEAIACYKRAMELDPKNGRLQYNLGLVLDDQKKLDEAFTCFMKAIELDPNLARAHNSLGDALLRKKKLDEAIAEFRKAIELDPNNAVFQFNLGVALYDQKKLDEAITCCKKAIELDPNFAPAHDYLGSSLYLKKKLDEAIAEYRKAIELDPNNGSARFGFALALRDQGKLTQDQAAAEFRKAIELDPKCAAAHTGLGNALYRKKKLDEAIAEYRKAIEIAPTFVAAHTGLSNALHDQGKLDQALAEARKAIELDPKDAMAHNSLGRALYRQKKLDEAVVAYRKAIELDPTFAIQQFNLGLVLSDQKKLDEAVACYKKAIELDPKLAPAHEKLGTLLRSQGKLDEAVAEFQKLLRLKPEYAGLLNELAWGLATAAERKNRDGRQAVALARLAVKAVPADGNLWNTLGAAHYRAGNWKEAVATFEKSMELRKGGDSSDWFFLAMAHWQLGDKGLARKWYAPAVLWMDKYASGDAQLRRFRDEAAALLSVSAKAPRPSSHNGDVEIWRLVLEVQPESVAARQRRGEAYAARSDWAQAAADYADVVERKPDADSHVWFEHACLRLLAGDAAGHAKVCVALLERGEQKKDLRPFLVARACTLAPLAASDSERAKRLAAGELKDPTGHWSLTEAAALEVRAGRCDRAEILLRRCLKDNPNWDGIILARLWLTLALHRQGKGDEARKELAPALLQLNRWGKEMPAQTMPGHIGLHLHDWLEAQILRREAEQLLKKKPEVKNPGSGKQAT